MEMDHQIKFNITGIIPVWLTRITVGLSWDAPQNIRSGYDIRAADKLKLTDENYIASPDKLLLNLHISQKFWSDRIEVYAGIKNVLNNISFMKGTDGRSMKDFYGLQEGIVGYFGVGIKYDAVPSKKGQAPVQETETPTVNMPMPSEGTMPMMPGVQQ